MYAGQGLTITSECTLHLFVTILAMLSGETPRRANDGMKGWSVTIDVQAFSPLGSGLAVVAAGSVA